MRVNRNYVLTEYVLNENDCIAGTQVALNNTTHNYKKHVGLKDKWMAPTMTFVTSSKASCEEIYLAIVE